MINIFNRGITLKEYTRLMSLGENAPDNERTKELLLKKSDKVFRTKQISDMTFSDFVDCESYKEQNDFENFCRIFVKLRFWETVYVHNLEPIVTEYERQKKELFEQHVYIFDPPQYGEPAKETVGTELRKEFVKEFGSYVVLMDVVCRGNLAQYKQVEQWKVSEFLFWANYLSGQKIIENVK